MSEKREIRNQPIERRLLKRLLNCNDGDFDYLVSLIEKSEMWFDEDIIEFVHKQLDFIIENSLRDRFSSLIYHLICLYIEKFEGEEGFEADYNNLAEINFRNPSERRLKLSLFIGYDLDDKLQFEIIDKLNSFLGGIV